MANKVFKTIEEQIGILEDRGLVIKDVEKAKEVLLRENYFFINGYRHLFTVKQGSDYFLPGTTFEELYAMFQFDRQIRNTFFKYLLVVENNMKSIISYQLSKKYGYKEKDYLNPDNFSQDSLKVRQVHDILNKMKRQIRVNGQKHSATMHYISKYGYIPMWILVKVLSFGIISELYSILKLEDQDAIASYYHMPSQLLELYISLIANFRNLCAHEDILYDHRTQRAIPDNDIHYRLNIPKDEDGYIYGKSDLFALVIMLKAFLSDAEFREMLNEIGYEIDVLDSKVDVVPLVTILNRIGFPENWRDILNL